MMEKNAKSAIEDALDEALTNLPAGAKVDVTFTPDGAMVLSVSPPQTSKFDDFDSKSDIIKNLYGHLVGQPITLTNAAERYNVPRGTLEKWYHRSGYLLPIDPNDYPAQFDEAEIAYLSDVYKERLPVGSRAPLLEDNGLPYRLKDPDLARYRRAKKKSHPLAK